MNLLKKIFITLCVISLGLVFLGCEPTAGDSSPNYVITYQLYNGDVPANETDLAPFKQNMADNGVSGTWVGHEFKLTQEGFNKVLEVGGTPGLTVTEYIELANAPNITAKGADYIRMDISITNLS